jgi:Tol biopolymer transport system component
MLASLALFLALCNSGETVEPVVTLPHALLMQKSSGAPPFRIVLMKTDRTIIDLSEGLSPQWSPDGSKIAYWANSVAGLNEIFIMNSDGGNIRNLTNSPSIYEARPVWSPNGSMIAFDEEAPGSGKGVGVMTSQGTAGHSVPSNTSYSNPFWFPNGMSILFEKKVGSRREIHSVNSDGTGEAILASDTTSTFANGSISPSGAYFAYSRGDSSGLSYTALVIRNLTSGHEEEFPGAIIGSLWSPQSDWLYCTEAASNGHTIFRISPTSKVKQDLSRKSAGKTYNDILSSLSSDGKWLALSSDQSGSTLIYMMSADGSNRQQVTLDAQLTSPFWKP